MKAAHRKELEKNVLADRLGRMATNIRKPPQRSTIYLIIGLLAVFAVFLVVLRIRYMGQQESAKRWVEFDDGYSEAITKLIQTSSSENVGKAALFQLAWMRTWDEGVKKLAADPKGALSNLQKAEDVYRKLAEMCKDDPVWEAEALYSLAIIQETRAVQDVKNLDKARSLFLQAADKHPQAVHGKWAKDRAEKLKEKTASRAAIEQFYKDLRDDLPQLRLSKLSHFP